MAEGRKRSRGRSYVREEEGGEERKEKKKKVKEK